MPALRHRPAGAVLLCNPQAAVGESPLIDAGGDVLASWTLPSPYLLRWDGKQCSRMTLGEPVWSLTLCDEDLVGNSEGHFLRMSAGGVIEAGPEIALGPGCRLNDMAADTRGELGAGSMQRGLLAGKGALWHAPNFSQAPRCVAEGLGVANGMVFSADSTTLFVIDTLARTLLAYPADIDAGQLGEPEVVTDFLGVPEQAGWTGVVTAGPALGGDVGRACGSRTGGERCACFVPSRSRPRTSAACASPTMGGCS